MNVRSGAMLCSCILLFFVCSFPICPHVCSGMCIISGVSSASGIVNRSFGHSAHLAISSVAFSTCSPFAFVLG